jgi:hypothetical protein
MPINRLLNGSRLAPEEVERLNRAFTCALRSLHLVDSNDPIVDIVARNRFPRQRSKNLVCSLVPESHPRCARAIESFDAAF